MKSFNSEGLRRLSALGAVLAAVMAQSFVTRGVDAEHQATSQTYGVQLLEHELAGPVPPVRYPPAALTPSVAEPQGSAATLLQQGLTAPSVTAPPVSGVAPKWRRVRSERRTLETVDVWPENRDASGALIQITKNDVLIPY
jgi:hypothetical protein